MRVAAISPDEPDRLAALAQYDALHPDLDPALDALVALARRLLDVPIALVSLVAEDRQLFAARTGLDVCGTARDISFCGHALGRDDPLVVPDARADPRFADNPLVTGAPFVRFYAGVPLRSPGGQDIGTFCLIDTRPRAAVSGRDRAVLRDLARLALDVLETRRIRLAAQAGHHRFLAVAVTSPYAILSADEAGRIRFWNDGAVALLGHDEADVIGTPIDHILPNLAGNDPETVLSALAETTTPVTARHRDGALIPVDLSLSVWRAGNAASFGMILREARREIEARLHSLAEGAGDDGAGAQATRPPPRRDASAADERLRA